MAAPPPHSSARRRPRCRRPFVLLSPQSDPDGSTETRRELTFVPSVRPRRLARPGTRAGTEPPLARRGERERMSGGAGRGRDRSGQSACAAGPGGGRTPPGLCGSFWPSSTSRHRTARQRHTRKLTREERKRVRGRSAQPRPSSPGPDTGQTQARQPPAAERGAGRGLAMPRMRAGKIIRVTL